MSQPLQTKDQKPWYGKGEVALLMGGLGVLAGPNLTVARSFLQCQANFLSVIYLETD
jgi:hypothetical protein